MTNIAPTKAWVITGPTSGIGHRTALELAQHGTVVLVGRDAGKLAAVQAEIEALPQGHAVSVVADMSDIASVRRAAAEIVALDLPIAGVLNNAGVFPLSEKKTPQGWNLAFVTNHVGPFVFTEALIPHLADGTNVVFITSAVEDPERKPAANAGFRGSRYISAEASVRGEWLAGGSKNAGYDAYATSKQGALATVLAFAREVPRLRFSAIEPGLNPGTGLGGDAPAALGVVAKIIAPLGNIVPTWSTPKRAARMITGVLTAEAGRSGEYYDEKGERMRGSAQVHDPAFQDRYVAETRALIQRMQPRPQPDQAGIVEVSMTKRYLTSLRTTRS